MDRWHILRCSTHMSLSLNSINVYLNSKSIASPASIYASSRRYVLRARHVGPAARAHDPPDLVLPAAEAVRGQEDGLIAAGEGARVDAHVGEQLLLARPVDLRKGSTRYRSYDHMIVIGI